MLVSKKTVVLYILGSVLLVLVCSALVYSFTMQSLQVKKTDLKGTYQFDNGGINNPEYLAVIESSKGDANESAGEFQWYNAAHEMLNQGTCKIQKRDFVTLNVDNQILGMIVNTDGRYYFIDDSFEYHEIFKISEVPSVISIN